MVQELPLHSHPIAYQQIGKDVWTQRPLNLALATSPVQPPPGHIIHNTLTNPKTETLIIGSNGSLHLNDQVAAAAWVIAADTESFMSATFIMDNTSSYTSHRIELEGIFRALSHLDYLNMTPTMVEQWCDNEQAVKDTGNPLADPSAMIKAEADIILAIHHLKNRLPYHTWIRHVYGHQDTKKAKHTNNDNDNGTNTTKHPTQTLINIACNKIATETSSHAITNMKHQAQSPILPPLLSLPYEGSRAMLRINDTWITSHHKDALYSTRRTKPMEEYLKAKYSWTDNTLGDIHWPSVKAVRQRLSQTKRMQTCKIMHGWLPVAHMRHHITGVNQCPGCNCTDKTTKHLGGMGVPIRSRV
jgi:hypothetical protein